MEPETKEKAKSLAKKLGAAALTIVARVVLLGAVGFVVGAVAFFAAWGAGLLDVPTWGAWRFLLFTLLPLQAVLSAVLLGHAGLVRGICRVAYRLAVDDGLVAHVLGKVLGFLQRKIEESERAAAAADKVDVLARRVPLQRFEDHLRGAIATYLGDDDLEAEARGVGRRVVRRIRRFLVARVETYLLTIVRAEEGGVSFARVRELATERAAEAVGDAILGIGRKQTMLSAALVALVSVLPAVVVFVLHRAR